MTGLVEFLDARLAEDASRAARHEGWVMEMQRLMNRD